MRAMRAWHYNNFQIFLEKKKYRKFIMLLSSYYYPPPACQQVTQRLISGTGGSFNKTEGKKGKKKENQ